MRRAAKRLMTYAGKLMPTEQKEWVEAMQAELSHIASPARALGFAAGCFQTALMSHLKAAKWEPVGRALLCFHISVWVFAKFYGGVKLTGAMQAGSVNLSAFQINMIGLSGFTYLGVAMCLVYRKWIAAMLCGLAALGLNTLHLIAAIFSGPASPRTAEHIDVFSLMIISEEYFIWTTVLVGGAIMWIWQTYFRKAEL